MTDLIETGQPVIEIRNLKKSFGEQKVLVDISLKLFNNENLVVLGKSGSGKSVLIKCIVRLLQSDGGSISALGQEVRSLNTEQLGKLRQKIGFLFQSGALYDSMTVRENLEFPLKRTKKEMNSSDINNKIKEVLEQVGLSDTPDKLPSQLSGGMRKRISLARTLIVDPLIMLYDEPTTGLDPVTSKEISSLIKDIQNRYKTSSLIITHDIACARLTADRVMMLKEGSVYKEGKPEDFEKSSDELIQSFFQ
ncbi:MAG: ABC transporter ATP-binding protein [Elusimicrobia bacterium RIFOXYB2_FULL_49_7]|nr:MAG: ABC transporter ATP-binding protein [Elusimicrobia bacterium RIFOXYB2_FULL_49_7]